MANPIPLPLYEKVHRKRSIPRSIELAILFLLLSLLAYRLFSLKKHGLPWLIAFFCESCFTFIWILIVNLKWNQVKCLSYPQRLLQRNVELPAVDMFVTTADDVLEPPILTMNTVLSLLAVDYPADKLACYLSDDAASPLTYYSLVETAKFAELWVPFCRKYDISPRAPFRYFAINSKTTLDGPLEFQQDWKIVKDKYQELCLKIEKASMTSLFPHELTEKFDIFSKMDKQNHPTIVKVIMENKEALLDGLPHLVYISREKRPKHPHHFKAGAMNVLTRVSGVMTNAPFMLNVDCDMFVNNPEAILHAMCMLLGVDDERDCAFAQYPPYFYDGLKDDPLGNQMAVLIEHLLHGLMSIQGPFYGGTSCFHRRKVIYGLSPDDKPTPENLVAEDLRKGFGKSTKFIESAAQILTGTPTNSYHYKKGHLGCLEAANQVASCSYEHGTRWGTEVGWMYGSATEDVLTGLGIHAKGWRSMCFWSDPHSFLGCAPSGGPASLIQMKRWSTGLLEILISSKNPIFATVYGKLQFRQFLAYVWIMTWALRSIPEMLYAALPAYCIITNSQFLPKVHEPAFLIPVSLFIIYNAYTLSEYLKLGLSIREWWNNQRMSRVNSMTSWLFGFLSVMLKLFGVSQVGFEVTQKEQNNISTGDANINAGTFTFDESPVFVSGTFILFINLTALVSGVVSFRSSTVDGGNNGMGIGEIICSLWVLLCFWAFFKGLFGKGKYGIPASIICKSGVLALFFVNFCKWTLKA